MENLFGILVDKSLIKLSQELGTILFAEFPTTTLFFDQNNHLIVKEWADCSDDGKTDRYFYYKTSKKNVARFLSNKLSHLELIRNSSDGLVYFQDELLNDFSDFTVVSANKIPKSYLPSSNFVLKKEDIVDFAKIDKILDLNNIDTNIELTTVVKEFANQKKSEIYNLHIKKGNGVGFGTIKTETLGKTLIKFENFYENVALDVLIGKERGTIDLKSKESKAKFIYAQSEVIGSLAASYSILIRPFQSDITLFEELSSSEKIANETFSLLNNSVDLDNLKNEYIKHSEYTISAFKGLLKEIYSLELDINISWVSDKKEVNYSQRINYNLANKIANDIDTLNITSEDKFKKKGKFRAINCDTGHFTFISNDEEQFTGYFDKQIREGSEQIVFTKIYEISVQRKIIKDASKDEPQIKDSIIGFYEDQK
ncbi:hypothetical protein CHRY9390_02648 [Chryseobacterium aquaeductus]|uniref:Uncharacterized protein n=1 Tax=Chryseobacterium aquaeductus TaxID=2675056 RepID=A0A9N8QSU8_9FLAO|nr:hypothetical protein [Chryseobacterium aquaeductus]CAA7331930.1 hypothetical protein CHRY9390_02648 [Chryseobacterium potabilaquae]CAD7813374.1 hypothetical protein CHRY9390_02648 [Chryseobacterium aquaeductus]